VQIVLNSNLARKTNVGREFSFDGETISFEFSHFTGLTFENFDAARRAARVSAAAVKNVDTGIFKDQNQFLSLGCFSFD
jgi:hypothetical protein